MKVRQIASNQTEVQFPNGNRVLVSYETPVAAYVLGQGYLRSETDYSRTTSKHISQWGARDGARVPQSTIDHLTANGGEMPRTGPEPIDWKRITNSVNGAPRYVCSFSYLLTKEERESGASVSDQYAMACARAKTIGGRRFHNKQFGGGIVFQSYALDDTERAIRQAVGA